MAIDALASGWAKAVGVDRKQFDMFFDKMLDGFAYHKIIVDKTGKPVDYVFLELNHAFEKMTGLKREKILGKKVTEVLLGIEKDPADWIGVYGKVALTGEPVQFENCNEALRKWFKVSAYCPEKGYFVALFEDITERKKAEAKLEEYQNNLERLVEERTNQISIERQRLFNVLEVLPVMVCLLTPDYYVAFANRAFREKFGESKGRHCHEYCFGKTDPCEFCESFIPLKTGNPHHWVPTTAEGLVIDAYDFPFTDVDGSKMILEMDIDVTEQVNLQKQLKDSERLATIGATAGMVGHDIRNPLQAITGDLYLAKTDLASIPESEEKQTIQESLTEIEKNIDYINKIVADLQDFARPLKPNAEETDLKLIIDQLLTKNGLPDDVQVTVKVEPDAGKFVADSTFINRIMYNLVSNAVQAMPKGGKLTIRAYKEASDVVIDVTDTGSGIPEAVKGKLFTPMFTTKAKGQGFGLPVIKRMTESLGGTVSFESQEGKGTTFTVRLPSPEVNGKWIYKQ